MKIRARSLLVLLFLSITVYVSAQSGTSSYTFQKGEVLDIIFMIDQAESEDAKKRYFQSAIPLAMKHGYQPQPAFRLPAPPSMGNYRPELMVIGKWPSLASRNEALQVLEQEIPDFHAMRREIWATFDLTYYETRVPLAFEVQRDKYNVVTMYWEKNRKRCKKFKQQLRETIQQQGGQVKLELANGVSPFGYHHRPDFLVLTEWESQAAFEQFQAAHSTMNFGSIEQVNQFQVH